MRAITLLSVVAGILVSQQSHVVAQDSNSCISLRDSTQCPGFQNAYVNPSNLSDDYPFFNDVNSRESFDAQFEEYMNNTQEYREEKISIGLQCNRTGSDTIAVQWERTFLCSLFSERSFNSDCASGQEKPLLACQDTCDQHSQSQQEIVDNPQICAPTVRLYPNHRETRLATLTSSNNTCSSWSSLISNDSAPCVKGEDNESNCGFGANISAQLCAACDPTGNVTIPSCCNAKNTDLSECGDYGHPGAAGILPSSTSSSATPTSTSSTESASSTAGLNAGSTATEQKNSAGLSKGQLAGILVGSIIGALLLGALIAALLCGRRRKKNDPEANRSAIYGATGGRSSSGDKPWTHSEDGMSRSLAGSPEMDKAAAGRSMNMSNIGAGALGAGVAGAGAAGLAASGEPRTSSPTNRPTSEALTSSSGDGKGATVQSVRDQYTGQDILVGEDVVAIYPYNASLNDEITLEPEQHIKILRLYDDGWALGRTADGHEGALPLVCVSSTKGDVPGRNGGTGTSTGTGTSDDEGLTSGNEYTSSVDGAVTAEEGGFTSDARSNRSRGVAR